jgi:hypothetical protein
MSKFVKLFAIAVIIAGAVVMAPGNAQARGGHHHHGGWRGGGWGWGYPYAYQPYYAAPACGYVRVWRRGHWVLRRAPCW